MYESGQLGAKIGGPSTTHIFALKKVALLYVRCTFAFRFANI